MPWTGRPSLRPAASLMSSRSRPAPLISTPGAAEKPTADQLRDWLPDRRLLDRTHDTPVRELTAGETRTEPDASSPPINGDQRAKPVCPHVKGDVIRQADTVIVRAESYGEWLDPETPVERLLELLKPYPSDQMQVKAVGTAVNSPKNDGPECLEAA